MFQYFAFSLDLCSSACKYSWIVYDTFVKGVFCALTEDITNLIMERGLNSWIDYVVIGIYFAFVIAVGLMVSVAFNFVSNL